MEESYAQFFTATILNWNPILHTNEYKQIITDSLAFLVEEQRIKVYAFVIMPNHIHLIWQAYGTHLQSSVQRDFLKFTSQQIQKDLRTNHPDLHKQFEVNKKDRRYQLWQRAPLNIELYTQSVFEQKLEYIHHNPISGKWNLAHDFVQYPYSSASFYMEGDQKYPFLTHYFEYFGR